MASRIASTIYYRLVQVDYDGAVAFSPVRTVNFDSDNSLRIYPLPANNVVHLQLDRSGLIMKYIMFDAFGKSCLEEQLELPQSAIELKLDDFAVGTYNIRLETDLGIQIRKVIIAR